MTMRQHAARLPRPSRVMGWCDEAKLDRDTDTTRAPVQHGARGRDKVCFSEDVLSVTDANHVHRLWLPHLTLLHYEAHYLRMLTFTPYIYIYIYLEKFGNRMFSFDILKN